MNEDNNPSEAVGSAVDVAADAGNENVSNTSGDETTLKILEEATGRKFGSKEEALKSLKETYSYVGKAGQIEKTLKKVMSAYNVKNIQELEAKIQTMPQTKSESPSKDALESKVEELSFLVEHPEAKPYIDLLRKFAKADNVTLNDAYQSDAFQDILKAKNAAEKVSKEASTLENNKRLGIPNDRVKKAAEMVANNPTFENKQNLVKEYLGL